MHLSYLSSGSAKNKMVNAIRMAMDFISRLPAESTPEKTEGHEGFFHPMGISGAVRGVDLKMLIRDHNNFRFEERMTYVRKMVEEMNKVWDNRVTADIKVQYHNLKNYLDKAPAVCDLAREAYRRIGVEIHEKPVRGGTDGAMLSWKGLPCPNLGTGGFNFHGVCECTTVERMDRCTEIVLNIISLYAE